MANETRKRWLARLGWPLFVLLLAGVGIGLHLILPPVPRWMVSAADRPGGVSPDGKTLLTFMEGAKDNAQCDGGPLEVWDTSTGRLRGSFFDDPDLEPFSSSVNFPFVFGGRYIPVALDDQRVRIADSATGHERTITLPTKEKPRTDFGEWSERPALYYLIFWEHDRSKKPNSNNWQSVPVKYYVVEAGTGDLVVTYPADLGEGFFPIFTVNEELLLYPSPTQNGTGIAVFNTKERRVVRTLPARKPVVCTKQPYLAAFTDIPSDCWQVWDFQTGERLLESSAGWDAQFSPDGQTFVVLTKQTIELWDIATRQKRATLPADHPFVRIEFSADSHFVGVFLGPDPNQTRRYGLVTDFSLWEVQTGQKIWEKSAADGSLLYSFSPDSQYLIRWLDGRSIPIGQYSSGNSAPPSTPAVPSSAPAPIPQEDIEIVQSLSGKVHWNIHRNASATDFLTAGEYLVWTDYVLVHEPTVLEKWLGAWYPFPQKESNIIVVGHIPSTTEIARLHFDHDTVPLHLSPDGRTLITCTGETTFQAWALPLRPRWGWVLGVPCGLGFLALLLKWWNARRKRMASADGSEAKAVAGTIARSAAGSE